MVPSTCVKRVGPVGMVAGSREEIEASDEATGSRDCFSEAGAHSLAVQPEAPLEHAWQDCIQRALWQYLLRLRETVRWVPVGFQSPC